jgi:hypothetical protein
LGKGTEPKQQVMQLVDHLIVLDKNDIVVNSENYATIEEVKLKEKLLTTE